MASPVTRYNPRNFSGLDTRAQSTAPQDFQTHTTFVYSNSREASPVFGASSTKIQCAPNPQMPPSPPMEPSMRISLPPISTLLGSPRQSPLVDHQNVSNETSANGVHRYDFANTLPRLTSPPTPPLRPERIDLRHVPGPQRTLKRLPPTQSPYESPVSKRRQLSSGHPRSSPVHHQRQSISSFSTGSTGSTRPVSPSSIHSAPAETIERHARAHQPATSMEQRSLLSESTPLTPHSPPSATSIVSRSSDTIGPWRHAGPVRYTPKLPAHLYTQAHSNSKPFSLTYPPQPTTVPPSEVSAVSDTLQQPLPDRYICPSCAKAFSRPSSLRIHVHSHTGEKPFRCPHKGCGKAFSVRSNMKRHQRGCHVEGVSTVIDSPRHNTSGMDIRRILA